MSNAALEVCRAPATAITTIHYAQCWEDAEVLLEALNVHSGATCVSIASGGDNTLALLSRSPERVIAVDVNPAQLACLELRVAAHTELNHGELLELMGSVSSTRRDVLYRRCRPYLSEGARLVWDTRREELARGGAGSAGRFERYLALFRQCVLPAVADRQGVARMLQPRSRRERERDYARYWETWRWRILSRLFFSRFFLKRLARAPGCFQYVDGAVAGRVLARLRHALTDCDPSGNPYLGWILTGTHPNALPYALRPENFEAIRRNLDRLEWRCQPIVEALESLPAHSVDSFNLSDVFEYASPAGCTRTLAAVARAGRRGARVAYWNLLARRNRPDALADRLRPLSDLAFRLHAMDKVFFYGDFVVEEVV